MAYGSKVLVLCTVTAALLGCAGSKAGVYQDHPFGEGGLVRGPRTIENVKTNMVRIMPRLLYLYAEALGPDSSLQGIVHVRMDILPDGETGYVGVHSSTMQSETFEDLLVAALMESRFDEWQDSRDKTEVIYPVEFMPEDARGAPKSRRRRVYEEQLKRREDMGQDTTAKQAPAGEWDQVPEEEESEGGWKGFN